MQLEKQNAFFPREKRRVLHPFGFQRDTVSADSVSFKSKQAHSSFQKVPLKRLPCLKCPQAQLGMVQATDPQRARTKARCAPHLPPEMLPGSSCLPRAEGKSEVGVPAHPGTWLPLCETTPGWTGDNVKLHCSFCLCYHS